MTQAAMKWTLGLPLVHTINSNTVTIHKEEYKRYDSALLLSSRQMVLENYA